MKKSTISVCILLISLFVYPQNYLPKSGTMNKYTVYNFSQHWNLTVPDSQIFQTLPDMIIRGWSQWDKSGTAPTDFNFSIISQYHQKSVSFIGGITATVYFFDQAEDSAQFKDMVTRDAYNNLVPHNIVGYGAFRGNIASPAYRDYLIKMAKIQIDGGTDGIFLDEVLSGYNGAKYNGNEGFDDYTLKDFNKYLAAKYPDYNKADWIDKFKMTENNYINTASPLIDLNQNFNYRKYLKNKGWQSDPLTASNLLATEWGKVIDNRADTISDTFLAKITTTYWREIVSRIRQYARNTYGKEILVTANGLFPYVDFNSLGMYDGNHDNNGAEVKYVPVDKSGHLNGSFSLQNVFTSLYQRNYSLAGDAPVILFIDWPTQSIKDYYNLSLNEKKDYWKIFAAEAYANGLFMAFHLRTAMPEDPTAAEQEMLDFFKDYPTFYKKNASLYHNNEIIEKQIEISENGISCSVMHYKDSERYSIHLVNHNYKAKTGMVPKKDVSISLKLDVVPKNVSIKSTDFSETIKPVTYFRNSVLNIKVDNLNYYNVIIIE